MRGFQIDWSFFKYHLTDKIFIYINNKSSPSYNTGLRGALITQRKLVRGVYDNVQMRMRSSDLGRVVLEASHGVCGDAVSASCVVTATVSGLRQLRSWLQ